MLKDDLLSLKGKLETIEIEFEKRLVEVEEKQKKFKEIENKFDEIIKTKDSWIKLNIGGKIFKTKLSTLLSIKDTLFYNLLSLHIENNTDIPNEIFIDRSFENFDLILDFIRNKNVNIKGKDKLQRLQIIDDFDFYGLDHFKQGKKNEVDIEWDQSLSKAGACTVDINDGRILKVHSTGCYTHFVTNKLWNNDNFQIELESTVTQTDNYYYIGLVNESYSMTGNCMCCNPPNSFFIKCDGNVYISQASYPMSNLSWNSQNVTIGMKVYLDEKKIYFYVEGKGECGPYTITGSNFRVVAGHCNSGNGNLKITNCFLI